MGIIKDSLKGENITKLNLNEDIFDDAIVVIEDETDTLPGPTTPEDNGVTSLLLDAINDEISTIDKYNVIIANIQNYPDFIPVIQDIVNEENNHVGMLQELLKKVSPNAEIISSGETEAKEILSMNEGLNMNESVESPYFKAFITNLGKYNEGELVGELVEFPIDEQAFEEVLNRIGINDYYEEWFVTDYDCNLDAFNWSELGEYPSYDELNEFGEAVASIDDIEAVNNALEVNSDVAEVIEGLRDGSITFVPDIRTDEDLGYYYIDMMGEITPDLANEYIDYEALGRDLSYDSYEDDDGNDISAGEYWCGDEDASDREIGEAYVEEVGVDGVSNLDSYFDYEAYGRDIRMDSMITFTKDGIIIEE